MIGETDLETTHPELCKEWHPTLNGDLTPNDFSAGSDQKIWWECAKGHVWQASICSRTSIGCGCPYCSNRKILAGFNDLETTHPELVEEWHPTLNGNLTPQQVTAGSNRAVWWECAKGHTWKAIIKSRSKGCGCPYCSNHKVLPGFNDLATTHPEVTKEWHPTLNPNITPQEVSAYSHKVVWWQCSLGHEWRSPIGTRNAKNSECPYCTGKKIWIGFNDLETTHPNLAKEWHPTLNGELTPQQVSAGSGRRVWWQCAKGHVWRAIIGNRTKGTGCLTCHHEFLQTSKKW